MHDDPKPPRTDPSNPSQQTLPVDPDLMTDLEFSDKGLVIRVDGQE